MKSITFTCNVITPLFMGGAEQQAELRTQSFKGMIRFWWRALGGSREDERKIFGWGGDNGNRSLIKIQIKKELNNIDKEKFNKKFSSDGKIIQCGFNYISFSLDQRFKKNQQKFQREYIKNKTEFTLKITFSPLIKDEEIKKVLATMWAVFYLGNFGSRARRGFGSVMVEKVEEKGVNNIDLRFDINKDIKDIKEWYLENIGKIKDIFIYSDKIDNIISISKDFKIYKLNKNNLYNVKEWVSEVQKERKGRFLANKFSLTQIKNPEDLLDVLGFLLMAYRSYYNPDYTNAKNIITTTTNNNRITYKDINRAIFGLPLNFFFSSNKKGDRIKAILPKGIQKEEENGKELRRASPIIFKIIKIDENNYEGLIIYAKSKYLPDNAKLKLGKTYLNTPDFTIIDNFFKTLLEKKIIMEIYND